MSEKVVVVGLGIVGCSIAATLARKGYRVIGIEQFEALHEFGSSHGDTRIYRRVPNEGETYVEMSNVSWYGWREWNTLAGESLLVECGGVDAGPENSEMVAASERLCKDYSQPYELQTAQMFNRCFPQFRLPPGWNTVYQRHSGLIRADETRRFLTNMAQSCGARMMHNTIVREIDPDAHSVSIDPGGALKYDVLIVAAGAWMTQLLPELCLPLWSERRVNGWYSPRGSSCLMDGSFPVFRFDCDGGWYGTPTPSGALKIGHNKHFSERVNSTEPHLSPGERDALRLAGCAQRYFNGFDETPSQMKPCICTMTPDGNFIIDHHPRHPSILLFSCCSGHGFKYAPAYGSIAYDLLNANARPDLASLALNRAALDVGGPRLTNHR